MSYEQIEEQASDSLQRQFVDVVIKCYQNESLMAEYERLRGERPRINVAKTPIDAMIDEACGYSGIDQPSEWGRFIWFVLNTVFIPVKVRQVQEAFEREFCQ